MGQDQHSLDDYIRKAVKAAVSVGLFLFLILLALTSKSFLPIFDFTSTGQIGDTIGGITAPFVGVAGAILTFLAFYMQFRANETHNRQFDEQSLEKERDKHENKILYLIKQNRNIVENMSIGSKVKGEMCFTRMYSEYRVAHDIVKSFYGDEIDKENLLNISYLIFHNGVGRTSNILNDSIISANRFSGLLNVFQDVSDNKVEIYSDRIKNEYNIEYDDAPLFELGYKPFDGHMTRLGQYFRNLFHILSYTNNIDNKLITEKEKYELIKSLRSQLSSYEQILIFFNSLSLYGKPLNENGFIKTFSIIKNIPIPLVEFAGDIHKYYDGREFEWDEIVKRAEKYQ